jgi:hypothetical protein
MSALPRDPCFFASCYLMKYAQEAAAWDLLTSSQGVLGLVIYASSSCWWHFCLIKGRRCRKTVGYIVLTREFADTTPERRSRLPLVENRPEIEEVTHTLIPVGHTCFLGLHTDLFVRSSLPKVTPLRTWFFDAGIHQYRLSYTLLEYHPVIFYHLSRCPELPYRKTVVWTFGSFL